MLMHSAELTVASRNGCSSLDSNLDVLHAISLTLSVVLHFIAFIVIIVIAMCATGQRSG